MKVSTYKCEVCGKQKEPTNHWFVLRVFGEESRGLMQIEPWSETAAEQEGAFHLCGQEHAIQKVSEFLSKPVVKAPEV
jgi:hypothetical protein